MTSISAALPPVYIQPVNVPSVTPSEVPVQPTAAVNNNQDTPVAPPAPTAAPATNANDSSAGIYTALANVSAPTIRGTNINTAT